MCIPCYWATHTCTYYRGICSDARTASKTRNCTQYSKSILISDSTCCDAAAASVPPAVLSLVAECSCSSFTKASRVARAAWRTSDTGSTARGATQGMTLPAASSAAYDCLVAIMACNAAMHQYHDNCYYLLLLFIWGQPCLTGLCLRRSPEGLFSTCWIRTTCEYVTSTVCDRHALLCTLQHGFRAPAQPRFHGIMLQFFDSSLWNWQNQRRSLPQPDVLRSV